MKAALCHSDRLHVGRDMCGSCYSKWKWRNDTEFRERKLKYAKQYRAERDADPVARQVYLDEQKGRNKKRNRKVTEKTREQSRERAKRFRARRAALLLQRLRVHRESEPDGGALPETG